MCGGGEDRQDLRCRGLRLIERQTFLRVLNADCRSRVCGRLEDELEFFGHMYGSFLRGYSFGFFNQGPWLFRFSCPSVNNIGDACDL